MFWGPIRSVRIEKADFVERDGQRVEGPRVLTQTIEYNAEGTHCEVATYNREGSVVQRIAETYDTEGHILQSATLKANGQIESRIEYKYDSSKRWNEMSLFRGDGSIASRTTFRYEDNKRFQESVSYDPGGSIVSKSTGVLDMKTHQMETVAETSTGVVQKRGAFTDIPNGQIYEQSTNDAPGERSVSMRRGNNGAEVTRYSPNGSITSQMRSASEVDNFGNVIKTVWSNLKGDVFEPSMVIYRSIEYYHGGQ
jgi:antitoxin component YwqK of YwqJK toxin-antitoxin module